MSLIRKNYCDKLSILGRKDLYKTEPLPGPGQYSVSEKLNNSAYKFNIF